MTTDPTDRTIAELHALAESASKAPRPLLSPEEIARMIEHAETEPTGTAWLSLQLMLREMLGFLHEFGQPRPPGYWHLAGCEGPPKADARRCSRERAGAGLLRSTRRRARCRET